jgi:3',5'-cyclic AMP phosphodiesterase CpdA
LTTIAHLSDLRFGTLERGLAEAVLADMVALAPQVVVVSGNLTQGGGAGQFAEAREFLGRLPGERVVVPGPRDVGGLNPIARFFNPLGGYKSAIGSDLTPFFTNQDTAVLGIDTSRSGSHTKISGAQAAVIRSKLGEGDRVTVLVSHHPLVPRPAAGSTSKGRLENQDLRAIGKCVDVVLAGHQTIAGPQDTRVAYRVLEKQSIVAQAGIAPGSSRDATPFYNAVRIDGDRVSIAVRLWRGKSFEEQGPKSYRLEGGAWEKIVDVPPDFQWNDAGAAAPVRG